MQAEDTMRHIYMDCNVSILEVKNDYEVLCLVECDESQTPTWFFARELEPS